MVDGGGIECVDGCVNGGGFRMVGWDSVIVYLYDINFSQTDGLAPSGAVDVGGFPMVGWVLSSSIVQYRL